jgi:hypothetical protein
MPVYFAAPNIQRAGVVAGFVLEAPIYAGVAQGAGMTAQFPIFNWNVTVPAGTYNPKETYTIGNYFLHTVAIGGRTYSYIQQPASGTPHNTDTSLTIATALVNAINGAGDPNATASVVTDSGYNIPGVGEMAGVMLTPRGNNGAVVAWSSEGGMFNGQLLELQDTVTPTITKGVLFANGAMYAPSVAPTLPQPTALAVSGQSAMSWLWYNTTSGFYWTATNAPTVSDDAFLGWVAIYDPSGGGMVVYGATLEVIAVAARRIGVGAEALILPAGAAAMNVGAITDTDTGAPTTAPSWAVAVAGINPSIEPTEGLLWIGGVGFGGANIAGVYALTFLVYYVNELLGCGYLPAAMGSGDTALPSGLVSLRIGAQPVVFTFSAVSIYGITIGAGYAHNITIGGTQYVYVQVSGDTAATIAAALAALIQAAVDENAMAEASGATVILTPLGISGTPITCTASDGNAVGTLTETQPSYFLIEQEIIEVMTANGSSIARGQKGSTAAAHPSGAPLWEVFTQPVFCAVTWSMIQQLTGALIELPFRGKAIVAMDGWSTNEFGDSPIREYNYSSELNGGRGRAYCGGQMDLSVSGVLAIGSDLCPPVAISQPVSVAAIIATVKGAPTGTDWIVVRLTIGTVQVYVQIFAGTTVGMLGMWTTGWGPSFSVDGLLISPGSGYTAPTPVQLDITEVGNTYPGNDLTVSLVF